MFMKKNGGFTLVELIVVIAILAILAGVAVPAYSGYVEKANKQADISLASEVAQALTLHYYSNSQKDDMVLSAVLTTSGITADGESAQAMQAAFGDNWNTANKLKHDKWGNGAAVTKEVVDYFNSNTNEALDSIFDGSAQISFTDNISELFDLMEKTAIDVAGKRESLGSGANMVSGAAGITVGKKAEEFSNLWASSAWSSDLLMGEGKGDSYNGNVSVLDEGELQKAVANAAVIKARNVALATYLKDEVGYEGGYDAIANYTYADSIVPNDAVGAFLGSNVGDLDLQFSSPEEEDRVYYAILDYYNMSETDTGELVQGDVTTSQAYTDGLAYYAMMSTVNSLKTSENLDKTNDETWWNDLSSAVDMYSAVANGNVSLEDLTNQYSNMDVSGNSITAMLMVKNGVPNVIISPVGANP